MSTSRNDTTRCDATARSACSADCSNGCSADCGCSAPLEAPAVKVVKCPVCGEVMDLVFEHNPDTDDVAAMWECPDRGCGERADVDPAVFHVSVRRLPMR